MSTQKTVFRQVGVYLSGSVAAQALTLVAAILTRNFLGPVQMGVWTLLQVFVRYAGYTSLGTMAAGAREIPFYRGKGEMDKAERIKNVFFCYNLVSGAAFSALLVVGAVFFRSRMKTEIFYGLLITAALLVLQRANNALITLLRAYKEFDLAARQMVVSAAANAVLMTVLAYRFRIYGYLWGMCLSFVFNIFYILRRRNFGIRWQLDRAIVRDLAVFGAPLVAIGFLNTVFISIDRLLVGKYLGLAELGIYGVAVLGASYAAKFPNEIGVVLIPSFHEKMGERQRDSDLTRYVTKSGRAFCDMVPLLIGPAWILAERALQLLMPAFAAAAEPFRYLMLGSFFLAAMQPYSAAVIAMRRHWLLFPALAVVCALVFWANRGVLQAGETLSAVALVGIGASALRFAAHYWIAAPRLYTRAACFGEFAKIGLKFVYLSFALALANRVGEGERLPVLAARLAVFALLYAPFWLRFSREYGVADALRRKFAKPAPGAVS